MKQPYQIIAAALLAGAVALPAAAALRAGAASVPVACLDYAELRAMVEAGDRQVLALAGTGSAGTRTGMPLRLAVTYRPGSREYTVYLIDPRSEVACVLSIGTLDHRGA